MRHFSTRSPQANGLRTPALPAWRPGALPCGATIHAGGEEYHHPYRQHYDDDDKYEPHHKNDGYHGYSDSYHGPEHYRHHDNDDGEQQYGSERDNSYHRRYYSYPGEAEDVCLQEVLNSDCVVNDAGDARTYT